MPVRRDKDGNIIDEKTAPSWGPPRAPRQGSAPSRRVGGSRGVPTTPVGEGRKGDRYGGSTKPVSERGSGKSRHDPRADGRTIVVSGGEGPMSDPPVGWLVIVNGPGKGNVATLRSGFNFIGRGRENRIPLEYGDRMISQARHCAVIYDEHNRQFRIKHEAGRNLTYLGDDPVLDTPVLEAFAQIRIGRTTLRFVPLCCDEFSWGEDG